jgi:hypothetical protein
VTAQDILEVVDFDEIQFAKSQDGFQLGPQFLVVHNQLLRMAATQAAGQDAHTPNFAPAAVAQNLLPQLLSCHTEFLLCPRPREMEEHARDA